VNAEVPIASLVPPQHEDPQAEGSSSQQQETTLEFSSSTLIDAPTNLHESTITIGSDTSPPPSTPEPDIHSFDNAAAKQVPLNPESSNVAFGSVSEVLKGRASIPSLYDSASSSTNRGGAVTPELSSAKIKRGSSFIKKSSALMNKVFKRDGSSENVNVNEPLASSLISEPEIHPTSGPDATLADVTPINKKLTSPSRVSLGSIRSISGSIKKKIGKSSGTASESSKDVVPAVSAQDEESHPSTSEPSLPSNSSQPSKVVDAEPSLLKTMFKVRKPSN
jgi:hypothetical protein